MRLYTLWTHILDTPWTPAIFPLIFRHISNQYLIISTFSCLSSTSRHMSNIACWSHSHCNLLPIASQHASPLFHPSYLQPIISLEIEVFSLMSHGHILLLWCITKVMTNTSFPWYYDPFRYFYHLVSHIFTFLYILPYLTHTRRIEERFVPPIIWDYCDFTATAFPLWLCLTPHTAASSYRPLTHYRVFYRIFCWISIAFLLHHIVHLTSSHRT